MTKFFRFTFYLVLINIFHLSLAHAFNGPDTFADLAEQVSPSVVNISTTGIIEQRGQEMPSIEDFFNFPFKMPSPEPSEREFSSLGSGFVISEDGYIVTNNHVVENASDIRVTFTDGLKLEAELIAFDTETDLALLKVNGEGLPHLEFGDSDTAKVGNWVMAIGNPHGLGGTVTAGIVSARGRMLGGRYDDFIQTDASINRGNSGGPLFDLDGKVIGVNSMIISPSGGSIGIGFAIPSNLAKNIIDQLATTGEIQRAWLGVRIQEVTKEIAEVENLKKPEGALVASVGKNSPADKAGIKAGDIILEFDNKKIDTMRTLPRVVASTEVGKSVVLKIWRNKRLITKRLILGRLESSEEFKEKKTKVVKKIEDIEALKIAVRDINEQDISSRNLDKKISGVVITEISNRSPLINLLDINDIIIEVQKTPVKDTKDLERLVNNIFKKGEKTLLLTVINKNNKRRYLGVKIN